jgi:hypothetical protein
MLLTDDDLISIMLVYIDMYIYTMLKNMFLGHELSLRCNYFLDPKQGG